MIFYSLFDLVNSAGQHFCVIGNRPQRQSCELYDSDIISIFHTVLIRRQHYPIPCGFLVDYAVMFLRATIPMLDDALAGEDVVHI